MPTVENPACAVCHDTIDPIAAGFQNWNEVNRYLPFRTSAGVDHALPSTYRSGNYPKDANNQAYYRSGDNWFRDEKEPGYGSTPMPGGVTGNKTALQWLGPQVAADPRFALGAVHFWYEGLFGREPLSMPQDATSAAVRRPVGGLHGAERRTAWRSPCASRATRATAPTTSKTCWST